MRPLLSLALLALSACATHAHPAAVAERQPDVPHVPRFGKFEQRLDTAADARVEIAEPSGHIVAIDTFPTRGASAFRFAPRELGLHRYVVRAGPRDLARGSFVADPSGDHGFLRIDPRRPHHFAFEDGTPFFVLGENRINVYDRAWNHEHADIEAYIGRMARAGMTTLRVFVFDDAEAEDAPDRAQLGALEPKIGQFDEAVAERFDRVFAAAEKYGIYVVFTLHAIGFSEGPNEPWKSWDDNPYSATRGGPAASPVDFFARAELRPLEAKKLGYALARWGYSTHLFAVDVLNEPEWDGKIPETAWIPWAAWMSDWMRAHDPYGHLATTGSVGLHWNSPGGDERPWYASPKNAFVQWHLYGKEYYEPHALAREMTRKVEETWGFGKPVVCGEFAYGGEDKVTYDHTHAGIWSLLMSGAGAIAHSAPPFEIDSDEPMTPARAAHFTALADFLRDAGAGDLEPRRDVIANQGIEVWSLRSDSGDRRAVWLLAPESGYGTTVSGATVTIPDLPAGKYLVAWRNDVTGAPLGQSIATSTSRPIGLVVPDFVRHVAATITPLR